MPFSRFERTLPWTGVLAALAWVGQSALFRTDTEARPGRASTDVIQADLVRNHAAIGCLVVMGVALVFFASALRAHLRSGEAREATYSAVAHGGLLLAAAGLSQMVVWSWGLVNGAADAGDDLALGVLSQVSFFGFAGMGIGLSAAMLATGLGGLANAVLPRWFAVTSIVMGALGALGNAGVPPGGLVNYLLMPLWLVAVAVIVVRRQRASAGTCLPAAPAPRAG
jgi:hypothetical protein